MLRLSKWLRLLRDYIAGWETIKILEWKQDLDSRRLLVKLGFQFKPGQEWIEVEAPIILERIEDWEGGRRIAHHKIGSYQPSCLPPLKNKIFKNGIYVCRYGCHLLIVDNMVADWAQTYRWVVVRLPDLVADKLADLCPSD